MRPGPGRISRRPSAGEVGANHPTEAVRSLTLALLAAVLFGAATPLNKVLLADLTPFQLAGLLYLGAACGVAPTTMRRGAPGAPWRVHRRSRLRLLGIVLAGGVIGPILLLLALQLEPASVVSLWLSFELAATAVLGVTLFRDHLGFAGWAGVACTLGGVILLATPGDAGGLRAGLCVLAACFCWGLDNQLSALIDDMSPAQITFWKGLVAGAVNLTIGLVRAPLDAGPRVVASGLLVGALSYGASIVLLISAARRIGATRAQASFTTAPFFGGALSVLLLHEPIGPGVFGASLLFGVGLVLLGRERHGHRHVHEAIEHDHEHRHDDVHHDHFHPDAPASTRHSHVHRHEAIVHDHPHSPDLHHRHPHHKDHPGPAPSRRSRPPRG